VKSKAHFSLLTIFFITLSAAFVSAMVIRVHSYSAIARHALEPTAGKKQAGAVSPDAPVPPTYTGGDPMIFDGTAAAHGQAQPTLASGAAGSSPLAFSQRERRFNEMLAAAQRTAAEAMMAAPGVRTVALSPPVAPPPTRSQAPAVSRAIKPIINALGGTSSSPSSSHSTGSTAEHQTPANGNKSNPDDPTNDVTAPQLLSHEFIPPQVQDGGTTTLTITATDDLTGIRSVTGTVTSPTGKANQSFAAQREGETNRYSAHITVPKDAEDGNWRLTYLNLQDGANNSATITYAPASTPPSALLRVTSSRPDSQAPTVRQAWVERRAMQAGEKNVVHIIAEDDKTGVNLVSGVFLSPSKIARIGFGCHVAGSETTWDCEFTTPQCLDCGDWVLEQVQVADKANNMGTIRSNDPAIAQVRVNINGTSCDNTPPTLQNLVLDQQVISNQQTSTIRVIATLSDDSCAVYSVSGNFNGPTPANGQQPPHAYFTLTHENGNVWSGSMSIPALSAKGIWTVGFVQALDNGYNLKVFSRGDPQLGNVSFRVQ
jgi:hypothetical protein